ncbi:MAG TPA: prepilin peptidase [Pseudonocardia sp.]|jgi:leader peptidase (prepilin peptidase)/N-methyltransferase
MAELVFFGGLGMLAGAAARALLGRLPRGALVGPPWCELTVGGLWAVAGHQWATGLLPGRWLPLLLGLGWLVAAAGAVDIAHRRLPDALTLPAFPMVLLLVMPLGQAPVGGAVGGGALLGAGYLAVRLCAPGSLGAGDVKLAVPLGAALGAVSWLSVLLGAVLAALLTGLLAILRSGIRALRRTRVGVGRRSGELPHGPSMLVAGWLVVVTSGTGGALQVWAP